MLEPLSVTEWLLMGILLAASAVPIACYFRGLNPLRPNVIGFLYLFHGLATVLPGIIFCIEGDKPLARTFLWAGILAAYLISVGGIVADIVVPRRSRSAPSLLGVPFADDGAVRLKAKMFFIGLLLVGLALFANTVSSSAHYPLRDLLTIGDAAFYREARREVTQSGYMQGLSQRFVMPLLFSFAIVHWSMFRGETGWRIAAAFAVVLAFIANSYAGNKTPTGVLFVLGFIIWLHYRHINRQTGQDRARRLRTYLIPAIAIAGAIGFPLFIYSQLPVGQTYGIMELLVHAVLRRIFLVPAENSYYAFEVFSSGEPFTYFRDMGKFAQVFGLDYYDLSTAISLYKMQGWDNNAPPTSIGTFFAQGGYPVLILGMVLAAATFRSFENVLLSERRPPPLAVAIYAILLFSAFRFSWAYFHTILLSEAIVPSILVLLLWRFVLKGRMRRGSSPASRRVPEHAASRSRTHNA